MRVQRALLAALTARLAPAVVTVVDAVERPWASVTFSGARFAFTLLVEGREAVASATKLQQTLDSAEFAIAGHIVADAIVTNLNADATGVRLDIEVLTVIDD